MQNINRVCMTALVVSSEMEKSGEIAWTVLKASPFHGDSVKEPAIRIVLHEMVAERKGRALGAGDIVLFWGKLSYYADLGITLYADSFLILSKSRKDAEVLMRNFVCLAYSDIPNEITLLGKVNNVADDQIVLKISRTSPVRGEIKDYDIITVPTQHPSRFHTLDSVFFSGYLKNGKLEGDLVNLSPQKTK